MTIEKQTKVDLETFLQRRKSNLRDFIDRSINDKHVDRDHLIEILQKDFLFDEKKVRSIIKELLHHNMDKVSKNEVNVTNDSPCGNDDLQKPETDQTEVSQITYYDSNEPNAEISDLSSSSVTKKPRNKKA
jgi:hypothetical protein